MAAAYAAVASLMNTIDHVQINHPRLFITSFDHKQIQSLHKNVVFLQQFLEGSRQQVEALESQIAAAAHAAEDVIESHATDQILAGSTGKSSSSLLDLQKVIQDMESIKEKVMVVIKGKDTVVYNMHQQPTHPMPATSSRLSTAEKSTMVRSDNNLIRLMDMLTEDQSTLQIIPVTGMGGIGKTTLAKTVYENFGYVKHFDRCGWVAVSQQHTVKGILVELVSSLEKQEKSANDQITEEKLKEKLHQFLFQRRYLIILDDVWSIESWDKIQNYFPDDKNSSRIVVTTRESSVASHFGSSSLVMNFLDEDRSWKLFYERAFGQEDCPTPELKKIGKEIVKKCKGLPLSIVVIGGLLRKSNRSRQHWENAAEDINSILLNSGEDDRCLNILSLSYTHLPAHLKPCFLYMGIFREDREIRVSQLIKLWFAEGFLKPNNAQSLKEVALCYFKDLVDRSLILVERLGRSGKIKTCKIHDLLRDLCLRVCEKEKLLCFTRVLGYRVGMDNERRIVFSKSILKEEYGPVVFRALQSGSLALALVRDGNKTGKELEMLRRISLNECGRDTLKPIFQQLRYIDCGSFYETPRHSSLFLTSIYLFLNLQTLVIKGYDPQYDAPSEIWEMRQLRYVDVYLICLPDPPASDHDQHDDILLNMQTLKEVVNFNLNEEVCRRISNIKKLNLLYRNVPTEMSSNDSLSDGDDLAGTISTYRLYNLGRFDKLETLSLKFFPPSFEYDLFQNLTFPSSLKKLSLTDCELYWDDLTIIGSLPYLEVFNLISDRVMGDEWNPIEGEFLRLKYLKFDECELVDWNADNSHFPFLETIILAGLVHLDEIPLSFGEIPTLRTIYVEYCSVSAAISAAKILEEQDSFGNEDIQVQVKFSNKRQFKSFKGEVEPHTLTSHNFQFEILR